VKSDWKVATKLFQIVQQIPIFIQEVKLAEEDNDRFFGRYHLGSYYELSMWSQKNGYACEEQDEADPSVFYKRFVVLTEISILLFEPRIGHEHETQKQGLLVAWATLLSLDSLKRYTERPNVVTFNWRLLEG